MHFKRKLSQAEPWLRAEHFIRGSPRRATSIASSRLLTSIGHPHHHSSRPEPHVALGYMILQPQLVSGLFMSSPVVCVPHRLARAWYFGAISGLFIYSFIYSCTKVWVFRILPSPFVCPRAPDLSEY